MAQLFERRADSLLRFAIFCLVFLFIGGFAIAELTANSDYATGQNLVLSQPVPFSHKHHVDELGINCVFCHASVEKSASAGMPATSTCMTCHSQIWTHALMLAPVRQSYAQHEPLHWNRVYSLPEYVYFNHAIHIAKGIGCATCHGPMQDMQMTREANAFSMRFCLSCHVNPKPNLRPLSQITNMRWKPPADQAKVSDQLAALYHLDLSGRLTDCSTCHR